MNTQRNIENLSRRDQRWLDLGLSLGAFLKRVFNDENSRGGATAHTDAFHKA